MTSESDPKIFNEALAAERVAQDRGGNVRAIYPQRAPAVGCDDVPFMPRHDDEDAGGRREAPARAIVPGSKRTSQWRCAADLEGKTVPPKEWLVPDMIPKRSITLLYGDGGTGKSLLSLQLAAAVATGGMWLGHQLKQGRAVFPSAEDEEDDLHRRLSDIIADMGCRFADLHNLTYRSFVGEDATFAQIEAPGRPLVPTELCQEVEELLSVQKPELLVLDTLADLFPGNENDKAQVRQFMNILKGLAFRHDCAVVLLAHPSLSGMASGMGTSGNVAWSGSSRARLYFERVTNHEGKEDNEDARVLRTMKANHGPKGGEIRATWRNGVFKMDAQESPLDRVARNAKAERVFLSLVRLYAEQGRPVNPERAASDFANDPDAEGIRKEAFQKAKASLLAQGKIRHGEHRRGGRPRNILEVVE